MKNTISLHPSSPSTDQLREQENHMYIPPDLLAVWLNDEVSKSKHEARAQKVLQAELDSLRDTRTTYTKQGDVYFMQPHQRVSAFSQEKSTAHIHRHHVLQAELDALMREFSNLSHFELAKP